MYAEMVSREINCFNRLFPRKKSCAHFTLIPNDNNCW